MDNSTHEVTIENKTIGSFTSKIVACAIMLCMITGLKYVSFGNVYIEKISNLVSWDYDFSKVVKWVGNLFETTPKPLESPVNGKITSVFGDNHKGIDIAADEGTDVLSADDGKVSESGENGNYGNCIKITHNNGMVTLYAHLSEISVNPGDSVTKGQLIGKVGSTGDSTGPHLHFEVKKDERYIDPEKVTEGL